MAVILESNDANYFENRAVEMIREAQNALAFGPNPNDLQLQQYHERMGKAIGLLVMARGVRQLKRKQAT